MPGLARPAQQGAELSRHWAVKGPGPRWKTWVKVHDCQKEGAPWRSQPCRGKRQEQKDKVIKIVDGLHGVSCPFGLHGGWYGMLDDQKHVPRFDEIFCLWCLSHPWFGHIIWTVGSSSPYVGLSVTVPVTVGILTILEKGPATIIPSSSVPAHVDHLYCKLLEITSSCSCRIS